MATGNSSDLLDKFMAARYAYNTWRKLSAGLNLVLNASFICLAASAVWWLIVGMQGGDRTLSFLVGLGLFVHTAVIFSLVLRLEYRKAENPESVIPPEYLKISNEDGYLTWAFTAEFLEKYLPRWKTAWFARNDKGGLVRMGELHAETRVPPTHKIRQEFASWGDALAWLRNHS